MQTRLSVIMFTLLILSLALPRAMAAGVDLHDLQAVELGILDNPEELLHWAEQEVVSGKPYDIQEQIRLTRILYTLRDDPPVLLIPLDASIKQALNLKLYSDAIDLQYLYIMELGSEDSVVEKSLRDLVDLASTMPGKIWRARALIHLSSFLTERGRNDEGLAAIQESYRIMQNLPDAHPTMTLPILLHLSTTLNATGQQDKAFVIFQEIQSLCDRYKLRFASQRNLYSIGKHYAHPGPSYDIEKAAEYTKRSLAIADELGENWENALVHTSLIDIERRRLNFAEAQEHARIALKAFEGKDRVWTAEVHYQWAEMLFAQKAYSQALVHLEKADQLYPPSYKRDHATLALLRSQIMKTLGQFDKALNAYEEFHRLDKEMAEGREQESYARNKASLGLQIEEQKNKALTAEKALTEQKLKTARLYVFLGILSFASFIGLIFLSVRLHRENRKIIELQEYIHRGVLLRFLPPMIVDEIISGRSRLESEPKEELVTVIFADIVNFTGLTEKLGVTQTALILNRFLQTMTEVIFAEGGTVDKFIGDAVMVLYGAPSQLRPEEQAERAVHCAVAMHAAVERLSGEFEQEFGTRLSIRIGINQGRAIVGTFGSLRRSDYTAVGPAVNLASRIEAKAHPREILLSASVAALLPAHRVQNRGFHAVKGYDHEVQLYTWIADSLAQAS